MSCFLGSCRGLGDLVNGNRVFSKPPNADGSYPADTHATNSCNQGYMFKIEIKSHYCSRWSGIWSPSAASVECIKCNLMNIYTFYARSIIFFENVVAKSLKNRRIPWDIRGRSMISHSGCQPLKGSSTYYLTLLSLSEIYALVPEL